ncbi:MAG: carboxypeptidase M32 [Rhodovibrionaceae bacterium]|nr:carboxypeptidase M32 [Rhodovibrionaceae bacterium]
MSREAYETLEIRFRRLNALREAAGMLHWDMSTMMPRGGAEARTEQLAALEVVTHDMLTAADVPELLDAAEEMAEALGEWQRANLREMRRQWLHAAAVPADLVEAQARATKRCEVVWREARAEADFAKVRDLLAEVLRLVREEAAAKAAAMGRSPYDALLDLYEPDGRSQRIDQIFADLATFLPGFLDEVLDAQARQPAPLKPEGPFPQARQDVLARRLMAAVGFDFEHGRLDTSVHPFSGGVPEDTRITTRYDEADFLTGMMGVLHETGHAMYERGLPAEWRRQPVGEARGMATHESQSLMVEMQAGRSAAFFAFAAPVMREAFGGEGAAWQADNLRRLYSRVEPGFIRVDADEVTYPAHVILRYRLEKAMIAGEMEIADLPGAWNDGLEELLGLRPPDDRLGCLQDIHWFDGAWGYFPTYTLGAMTAAQLYEAAAVQAPEIPEALSRGDFSPLMAWLRKNVHSQGSRWSSEELLVRATGKPLDPEVFKAHLRARYLPEGRTGAS